MRLVVLAVLSLAPAAADAYCRTEADRDQTNPTACPTGGVPLAWARRCTGVRINPTVLPSRLTATEFRAFLGSAAAAWGSFTCDGAATGPAFALAVLPDLAMDAGYSDTLPNANVVLFRPRWGDDAFHTLDAAAITVVTYTSSRGEILDADTEMNLRSTTNPQGFLFASDGSTAAADLPTILTHELGHTQGLAHSSDRAAVMWYSAGRGEQRRVPTADDRAGLCAVYPPAAPAACDLDPGLLVFEGSGLTCGTRPGAAHHGAACAGLALLVVGAARRRRGLGS